VLKNSDMTVDKFITKFRLDSFRGKMPSEVLNRTVRQALESGNTTARKLLIDARFAK